MRFVQQHWIRYIRVKASELHWYYCSLSYHDKHQHGLYTLTGDAQPVTQTAFFFVHRYSHFSLLHISPWMYRLLSLWTFGLFGWTLAFSLHCSSLVCGFSWNFWFISVIFWHQSISWDGSLPSRHPPIKRLDTHCNPKCDSFLDARYSSSLFYSSFNLKSKFTETVSVDNTLPHIITLFGKNEQHSINENVPHCSRFHSSLSIACFVLSLLYFTPVLSTRSRFRRLSSWFFLVVFRLCDLLWSHVADLESVEWWALVPGCWLLCCSNIEPVYLSLYAWTILLCPILPRWTQQASFRRWRPLRTWIRIGMPNDVQLRPFQMWFLRNLQRIVPPRLENIYTLDC